MTYEDTIRSTAEEAVAQVLAAVTLYESGALTAEALASVVASYVAAGKSTAAAAADMSLAATLSTQLAEPVPTIGVTIPEAEVARLERAATTLTEDPNATVERYERLARAEVQQAASDAYSDAIRQSERVTGWTRGLDADPCQLCRWWYRDGRIWPADHPMPRHTGCECVPVPVTSLTEIRPVQR